MNNIWILSNPRVGSMLLSDICNQLLDLEEDNSFQEYLFFEDRFFGRINDIKSKKSTIRFGSDNFWFKSYESLFDRPYKTVVSTMLHGSKSQIEELQKSSLFKRFSATIQNYIFKNGLPKYIKVHRRHFLLFLLDDWLISGPDHIKQHLNNTKFICLERINKIEQAVSLYISFHT